MKKNILPVFLILILAFIALTWFKDGVYIGGGEEGLPLYNALRTLTNSSLGWAEFGTGVYLPSFVARSTLMLIASILQVFLTPTITQMVIYFLLFVSGVLGTYFLSGEFINNKTVKLSAGLFYFFNIFTMVQVWNRNIYAGYFAWAYLPVFLYLWKKYIDNGKLKYLLLLLLSSVVYSTTFVTLPFLFAILLPATFYSIYKFLEIKERKKSFRIFLRAFFAGILWCLFQFWWLYPLFTASSGLYEVSAVLDHFGILHGLSQWYPNKELLLLRQTAYFTKDAVKDEFWYTFYVDPWVIRLSFVALFITCIGLAKTARIRKLRYVAILFILTWFLVKGTNWPFGYTFYKFLFENFPFTAIFRNSYEKLGVMFVLSYSILFGIGIDALSGRLQKFKKTFTSVILFLVCGVLVWPMWTGGLYADFVKLHIPASYIKVNKLINEDKRDLRILTLPAIKGESAYYKWGYKGVVPMEYLFDKPVISHSYFGSPIADFYHELNRDLENESVVEFDTWLQKLNIGYIVVHYDIFNKESGAIDSQKVNDFINKNPNIKLVKKEDDLVLYQYMNGVIGKRFVTERETVVEEKNEGLGRFVVTIKGAKKPFLLTFKSTYHDFWEAKIDGKVIDTHKKVDDWANGWEITKMGDYNINIGFKMYPWQ